MRRILAIAAALVLLIALLAGTVSAQTCAETVNIYATVSTDGSCQVTLTVMLHLEQATGQLYFPVPAEAESVTLNGTRVSTVRTAAGRQVDLSAMLGNFVGDFSITLTYILRDVVDYNDKDMLQLELPLLAGFAYPVEKMEYAVTLPGPVASKPAFSSGYHQANIEKDLVSEMSGSVISGSATKALKDHETLTMTLPVSEEMFPQNRIELPDFDFIKTIMWICVGLALLYWLIFLRCGIPRRLTCTAGPEGFSAGQMGSVLHLQGADLTWMVFSWAQMGYLRLRKGRGGTVLLQKCMDMGNERSAFEQRCFHNLFGRRDVVDTAQLHYAQQWESAAKTVPGIQALIHPKTGNMKIFRALAALVGLGGGVSLGIALSVGAALQWLLVILFGILGFLVSWRIHRWAECLFQQRKKPLWVSLALIVIWLGACILAGTFSMGFWTVCFQLLAGLLAAFGGRRTYAGMQASAEVLGLRRYLRRVSREDLQRISQGNPEYFFTMIPYALALGVDKKFAKRFGKMSLPTCPYMDMDGQVQLTAEGWSQRLRQVADAMDQRRKKMWSERITGALSSLKK